MTGPDFAPLPDDERAAAESAGDAGGKPPRTVATLPDAAEAIHEYRDAAGALAFIVCRMPAREGRKVFLPHTPHGDGWLRKMPPGPRPLYRLPELLAADEGEQVLVVEGEKCADAVAAALPGVVVTTWAGGAAAWRKTDWGPLDNRRVLLVADADDPGRKAMRDLAAHLSPRAAEVRIALPDGDDGHDVADEIEAGGARDAAAWLKALARPFEATPAAADGDGAKEGADEAGNAGKRPSQSGLLIDIAERECALFHCDEKAFADIETDGRRETWPVESSGFMRWLRLRYFREHGGAPNAEALQSARNTIEAMARHEGEKRQVFRRVATREGRLYVDLCDDRWRAVEIDAEGWRVVDRPPVRFTRTRNMRPLPAPEKGGGVADLRPFINVADDGFTLVVAWVLAALRSEGPFPVLVLTGEQGSAKSTTERVLASLVDPCEAQLRSPPRAEQDLFVAARNAHVLAFDNMGAIPAWLSDGFCRLSTGSAFATRELYTNTEESFIAAARPVILNGIEEIVVRGDLADRAIFLALDHIPETGRRTEAELRAEFEAARPRIFGALLDALSIGLRRMNEPDVRLDSRPRMADFAQWAVACEPGFAEPGAFMRAYTGNRAEAAQAVADASPVATAIRELMERKGGYWEGRATELYDALSDIAGERVTKSRGWPGNAAALSRERKRIQSALRPFGIEWSRFGTGVRRGIRISGRPENGPEIASLASLASRSQGFRGVERDAMTRPVTRFEERGGVASQPEARDSGACDANDANDATSGPLSGAAPDDPDDPDPEREAIMREAEFADPDHDEGTDQ